jgi:hypothetical protein
LARCRFDIAQAAAMWIVQDLSKWRSTMKKRVQWTAALGAALLACGLAHAQDAPPAANQAQQQTTNQVQSAQAAVDANAGGKTRQQVEDELAAARRSGELQELNHALYSHH